MNEITNAQVNASTPKAMHRCGLPNTSGSSASTQGDRMESNPAPDSPFPEWF